MAGNGEARRGGKGGGAFPAMFPEPWVGRRLGNMAGKRLAVDSANKPHARTNIAPEFGTTCGSPLPDCLKIVRRMAVPLPKVMKATVRFGL